MRHIAALWYQNRNKKGLGSPPAVKPKPYGRLEKTVAHSAALHCARTTFF